MTARRRFGSIRKQRNGRYQARYRGPDGLTRNGPSTFSNKTDAAKFLDAVSTELARGTWSQPSSVPLKTYATEWLEHRKGRGGQPLALRTVDLYADVLRLHVLPQLGAMPVNCISPADIRRWHTDRLLNTGSTRVRHAYSLLRAILTVAVRDGILRTNPCQIVGAGQVNSPERPYLSRWQAEALADAMPPELRPMVVLTLWAHLRLGEALAVRHGDLDIEAGTLRVERAVSRTRAGLIETTTKSGRVRTLHLPSQAVSEMSAHVEAVGLVLPSARLFRRPDGAVLQAHHVHVSWDKARLAVGLPGARFHDLRHAGLTYVAQMGASTRELMARGGHSTPRAALIYQHAADERDAALAALLSDPPPAQLESGAELA